VIEIAEIAAEVEVATETAEMAEIVDTAAIAIECEPFAHETSYGNFSAQA
jgi:hypothetical protein